LYFCLGSAVVSGAFLLLPLWCQLLYLMYHANCDSLISGCAVWRSRGSRLQK